MESTTRIWLLLAGINGLMAVAAGAFGAHGVTDPQVKDWLRTGAQYQLVHAVAALACYGFMRMALFQAGWAGWLFGLGGLVFGGSLYLMALTGVRMLGAVTPIGGVLLMLGWAMVIWGVIAGSLVGRS
jgi:uncharacterized membrane protein YgdD (TMEM256/DUF423 family)